MNSSAKIEQATKVPDPTDDGRLLVITAWKGTDSRLQILHEDFQTEHPEPVICDRGVARNARSCGRSRAMWHA